MTLGKTIAFHSYKGGTGKTTLISNLAALYAKNGKTVCLLDFDLYAPSLFAYFRKSPSCYLNDLLRGEAGISDILVDVTSELGLNGKLLVGFSSPRKEDINEIEIKHELKWQLAAMRRVLAAKNQLFEDSKIDYLLLDTSPGIRYWSINALAIADGLFLVMKISDMDIEGTKRMIKDIYDSLTRFGSRYYLILNKVPGASPNSKYFSEKEAVAAVVDLERDTGSRVVASIPCFCDVSFNRHEFLSAVKQPEHLFSKKLIGLSEAIKDL
jgi:MinD-like ATPase involved in chromosome partitioning or flagellar assembly